jgi:hypothetical protein
VRGTSAACRLGLAEIVLQRHRAVALALYFLAVAHGYRRHVVIDAVPGVVFPELVIGIGALRLLDLDLLGAVGFQRAPLPLQTIKLGSIAGLDRLF